MTACFFVSDLHGHTDRYQKLFKAISREKPEVVFLGGDLLPSGLVSYQSIDFAHRDFIKDFLVAELNKLRRAEKYPRIFLILGNDDLKFEETAILEAQTQGVWEYIHNRKIQLGNFQVYGYAYVPPTPFRLKDWERYDVSQSLEPGCFAPQEGQHSISVSDYELKYATIQKDLNILIGKDNLEKAIFLFHAPPYKTNLDRAALDGKMIEHVPLDVHIGSIAIRRFIEERQPFLTLHGHVHESARIQGSWKDQIGRTPVFSAAHDGPELAMVRIDLENPEQATRELI